MCLATTFNEAEENLISPHNPTRVIKGQVWVCAYNHISIFESPTANSSAKPVLAMTRSASYLMNILITAPPPMSGLRPPGFRVKLSIRTDFYSPCSFSSVFFSLGGRL